MNSPAILPPRSLNDLLPMHLVVAADGAVISIGPTLRKIAPDLGHGLHAFHPARGDRARPVLDLIRAAMTTRERLFLRVEGADDLVLRGHAVQLGDGAILLNLGVGSDLQAAIRHGSLTDDDFAPPELAMEFLFLQEANRGVLRELARFNSQLARSREVAIQQAQTDPLTGLSNRRGLELALQGALRRPQEVGMTPEECAFALVHLDLDHFKQVNDRLGHKTGDELLRHVGVVLRGIVRKVDIAARIGGDEFVLILRRMTNRGDIDRIANRLIGSIRALSPPELGDLRVSASLGVVIWRPGDTEDMVDLLHQTDKALYASKREGRGRATIR
ncbi:GGDEF domain-containing protein [Paracoccus sp. 1_MG-2023]|uniref:GGDEF domain-containing protein n=1 Tax=unclassified Paracoccus (in: a-proteobacteria) TaxID=2688777 RepID=UPI001C08C3F4|nr:MULTISPECIES: GGDEF domain-containing protein [unclassified Paracoccus (in: a-proteobacteria)]MBU2956765.1 GGDEF domain-containing protein [Paracoccus sp. C2R09]MDO6669196.1 GGDEF domain-containing protein [Paracoccus sp. 1_MG-2023]